MYSPRKSGARSWVASGDAIRSLRLWFGQSFTEWDSDFGFIEVVYRAAPTSSCRGTGKLFLCMDVSGMVTRGAQDRSDRQQTQTSGIRNSERTLLEIRTSKGNFAEMAGGSLSFGNARAGSPRCCCGN